MYSAGLSGGGRSSNYEVMFDRKPSYGSGLSSDYYTAGTASASSSSRHEPMSAYDRYISDLTGVRTNAYTTTTTSSYSSNDLFGASSSSATSRPRTSGRTYVFEPDFEPLSTKYSARNYGRSSSDSFSGSGIGTTASRTTTHHHESSSNTSSSYVPRYSSRLNSSSSHNHGISSAPAYDKFGKELSNYERSEWWKLSSSGGGFDDVISSNNDYLSRNGSGGLGSSSALDNEAQALRRKRLAAAEVATTSPSSSTDSGRSERGRTVIGETTRSSASQALSNGLREYSVAPSSIGGGSILKSPNLDSSDVAGDLPAITGSRFSGKSSSGGGLSGSRRSVEPSGYTQLPSISSSSAAKTGGYDKRYDSKYVTSFPSDVRSKLLGYDVRDVRGDGGCYYRCLSVYFTGEEDSYNRYRKEVMSYIKQNEDNYKSMIKSEVGYASINDYFVRKTRSDRQEFAETTEIIATSCLYNINVHVLALVPGSRRSWEWLHFDPSIGTGRPSTATRDIYLYNQGSVHFMLCTPK